MRGIFCDGSWLTDWSSGVVCPKLSQCRWKSREGSSYSIVILNYAIRVIVHLCVPVPAAAEPPVWRIVIVFVPVETDNTAVAV